jgi:hypothetical protein
MLLYFGSTRDRGPASSRALLSQLAERKIPRILYEDDSNLAWPLADTLAFEQSTHERKKVEKFSPT